MHRNSKEARLTKWIKCLVRGRHSRSASLAIAASCTDTPPTTPVKCFSLCYLSLSKRFGSFASVRLGRSGKYCNSSAYSPSISAPIITPESARAYEFSFALISLEQARTNAKVVFRKEAYEEVMEKVQSGDRQFDNGQVLKFCFQESCRSNLSISNLSHTPTCDNSMAQLSDAQLPYLCGHTTNSMDDLSVYSTPNADDVPRPMSSGPHIDTFIQSGIFDISTELSIVMGSIHEDREYNFSFSTVDNFAPALATFAARAAVRRAQQAEALDA